MSAVYLIDGRPHRMCECDNRSTTCPRGATRALQTAGYNQCLVPAPDVMLVSGMQSETASTPADVAALIDAGPRDGESQQEYARRAVGRMLNRSGRQSADTSVTAAEVEEFRRENVIEAHVGETPSAGLEPWAVQSNRVLNYLCDLALRSRSAKGAIYPSPNTLWVVWFEDKAHPPEVFFGEGAEGCARLRYKQAYDNWSCHLLVRVPSEPADSGFTHK